MDVKIRTENLTKIFGGAIEKKPVLALDSLNLEIRSGEVFAFLGQNGAGKTTTIKLLTRLIRPSKGKIIIDGVSNRSTQALQKLGYLPEQPNLYGYLTGREFLDFIGQLFHIEKTSRQKRVQELLEKVGIEKSADRKIRGYSRGMTQRLGFAQALINDPDILILDEPLSNLDPIGRKDIRDIILELKEQGRTIFFSSHILSDAELVADRVGFISHGKLIKTGALDELVEDQNAGCEITFTLDSDKQNKVKKLLEDSVNQGEKIMIRIKDQTQVNDHIKQIIDAGGHILSVITQKRSLEDIFMDQVGR